MKDVNRLVHTRANPIALRRARCDEATTASGLAYSSLPMA
jgi:hypothetical protein